MDRDAFRQQQLAKPALDSSEQLLQPTNSAARDSSSTMPASPAWASMKVETASPSERPELAPPMTRHSLPAPPQVPQAQGSNEHQLPAPPAPQPSRAHRRTNPVCQVDGCKEDLSDEKYKVYHRRNRICDEHFKCLVCFHKGQNMRYCQQCHKFHEIDAFDFGKHSCRAKLQKRAGKGQRAAAALSAADREHESQRMRGGQDASDTSGLGLSMTDASSSASLAMDSEANLSLMPGGLTTRLGFGGGQSGMQVGLGGTWRGLQASQLQPGGTWTPSVGGLLSTDASQRQLLQQQQQQVHFAGHMMSVDPAGNLLDRQGSILSAMSNATSADASFGSLAEWRHLQALQQQQQQQQQQLMLQRQVSQVPRADLGGAFTLPSLGHGLGSGLPRGDLALLGFDTALSQAVRREEEMQQAMGQLQAQLQQQQQAEQQQRQLLLLQQQQQQQQQQQLLQAQQGTGLGSMAFTLQRGPARVGSRGSGVDELMSTFDIDGRSSAGSVGNLALHGTWAENELERLSRERQRQQPAHGSAGMSTSAEDLAVQHLRLQRGFSGVQDLAAQQQQQQQQQQQHTLLGSTQVQQVAPGASMLHALDPQTFALQQQRLWHATQPGSGQAQGTHMLHAQNTSMAPALLASAPGQRQGSPTDQRPNRMLSDMYAARGWQPDQPGL